MKMQKAFEKKNHLDYRNVKMDYLLRNSHFIGKEFLIISPPSNETISIPEITESKKEKIGCGNISTGFKEADDN